jgi:hypothetical protein
LEKIAEWLQRQYHKQVRRIGYQNLKIYRFRHAYLFSPASEGRILVETLPKIWKSKKYKKEENIIIKYLLFGIRHGSTYDSSFTVDLQNQLIKSSVKELEFDPKVVKTFIKCLVDRFNYCCLLNPNHDFHLST